MTERNKGMDSLMDWFEWMAEDLTWPYLITIYSSGPGDWLRHGCLQRSPSLLGQSSGMEWRDRLEGGLEP